MKILFSAGYLYPPVGGAERSMTTLLKALAGKGYEVFSLNGGFHPAFRRNLLLRESFPIFITPRLLEYTKVVFDNYRPDVVFTQEAGSTEVIELAGAYRVPVILFVRSCAYFCPDTIKMTKCDRKCESCSDSSDKDFEKKKGIVRRAGKAATKADHLVYNSNFMKGLIGDLIGRDDGLIVYPLVDFHDFRVEGEMERKYILLVGALDYKGGRIFSRKAKDLPYPCRACGSISPDIIREMKENENIEYIGKIKDMKKVYCRTKCLVVLSQWYEPLSRVVIEANLNGIPVAGVDSGGIPEAVGEGGYIMGEGEDLEEAIEKTLRVPPQRCRENAERFRPEKQIGKMVDLLEEINSKTGREEPRRSSRLKGESTLSGSFALLEKYLATQVVSAKRAV